MAWIKRNLVLVIAGVVSLVLLGLGVWYLMSALDNNDRLDKENESTRSEIKTLLDKPVTPTAENLKSAKQEGERLRIFIAEGKSHFPASPPAGPLDSLSFKSLLANTINDLHREATNIGIKIDPEIGGPAPAPYYFTFSNQRLALNLPPESLRPLRERLYEVQFIAETLFKARINRLLNMKRSMVSGERPTGGANQPGGGNDYLSTFAHTNAETGMAIWPYEVTFDCFTSELARVLEGFQSSKYGFVIKDVKVNPADETVLPPNARPPFGQPPLRGRGGVNPNAAAAAAAAGTPNLVTIINEKLLRVTLHIEVIKPELFGLGGGPGGGPGGGGPGGGPPGGGRQGRGGPRGAAPAAPAGGTPP